LLSVIGRKRQVVHSKRGQIGAIMQYYYIILVILLYLGVLGAC